MNLSVANLGSILKLAASSPAEAKALLKLVSIDIMKNLGQGNYLIQVDGEHLSAQSDKMLKPSERFWAELSATPGKQANISHLVKQPLLFQKLAALPIRMEFDQIIQLLQGKTPQKTMHEMLLEPMAQAGSKEEFNALTQLMLSLHHNVLTLPLHYAHYFGFLQMKKRYNTKTKKTSIDFFAALHHLGPVEGSIELADGEVFTTVNVAFESTLSYLKNNLDDLNHTVRLQLKSDGLTPLWQNEGSALLDVSI